MKNISIYSAFLVRVILTFLSMLLINFTSSAEIRYVSKTGSSTPPFLSWSTAADSIQECINISSSGDTIYVWNGVYKEIIDMIPGLALVGMDWDSTVIDTRGMLSIGYYSVTLRDSCSISGFKLIASGENYIGAGIYSPSSLSNTVGEISNNKIFYGLRGIRVGNGIIKIQNNIITNSEYGIFLDDVNNHCINNNLIITPKSIGINIQVGSLNPIIKNNILIIKNGASGIGAAFNYGSTRTNNLIIGENANIAMSCENNDTLMNNVIYGKFNTGIFSYGRDYVKNNSIMTNGGVGYEFLWGIVGKIQYNNFWNNSRNFLNFAGDSTNISFDPMFVNPDSQDFHLQMFSPLIDAGDPSILDVDSTRSDIGLYGGPFGEKYQYQDLAPRAPKGLIVSADSNNVITIKWKKNTEADFNYYKLFRDTAASFTADSTTLVGVFEDTLYSHITPSGTERFYYKLTAVDNQLNESELSEEIGINLTALEEDFEVITNYQLFQNYPNPFNPSTLIPFRIKERAYVKLRVYNIQGELVSVIVNETKEAGYYEAEFYGQPTLPGADRLTSGIYLYKLDVTGQGNIPVYSDMKKMIYLK